VLCHLSTAQQLSTRQLDDLRARLQRIAPFLTHTQAPVCGLNFWHTHQRQQPHNEHMQQQQQQQQQQGTQTPVLILNDDMQLAAQLEGCLEASVTLKGSESLQQQKQQQQSLLQDQQRQQQSQQQQHHHHQQRVGLPLVDLSDLSTEVGVEQIVMISQTLAFHPSLQF
jgi:hypothetical protein